MIGKNLSPEQMEVLSPGYAERQRKHFQGAFASAAPKPRWRIIEKPYQFLIACERERCHIEIVCGDNPSNIPLFGTLAEARADAETICEALNRRDAAAPKPQVPGGE